MGHGYEQNNETERPPKPGVSLVSGSLLGSGVWSSFVWVWVWGALCWVRPYNSATDIFLRTCEGGEHKKDRRGGKRCSGEEVLGQDWKQLPCHFYRVSRA